MVWRRGLIWSGRVVRAGRVARAKRAWAGKILASVSGAVRRARLAVVSRSRVASRAVRAASSRSQQRHQLIDLRHDPPLLGEGWEGEREACAICHVT